jgi:hypothetical protein
VWGAVRAVAAADLRRRWRAVLAIGLAFGVIGAVVTAAGTTARRTATAYDRLVAASAIEDVRALLFDRSLADALAALPGVEASWSSAIAIARLEGPGVVYTGWVVGPEPPPDLAVPVVVEGRAADPTQADEVTVDEGYAEAFGLRVGDVLGYDFLTPEEVNQFDTGFGAPDGPHVDVRLVGLTRAPGGQNQSPVLATPAFDDRYGGEVAAGSVVALRLADGPDGIPALRGALDDLLAALPAPPDDVDFAPVQLDDPLDDRTNVHAASSVLVLGLLAFLVVGGVVGLVAAGQALTRHHGAGAEAQRIEAALGLTAAERAAARLLVLAPGIALAALAAAAGGLVAGTVEPLGAVARYEPAPGWAPNLAGAAGGAAAVALALAWLGLATARRAGRPQVARRARITRPPLTAVPLPAPAAVGLGLAVTHPDSGRSAPTRSSVVGAVLGVAGVVGALAFGASLDRLVAEPARWGWAGDVVVVDTNPEIVESLLADPRVVALTRVDSAEVRLAGDDLTAFTFTDLRGSLGWTILDGRPPAAADEVVLGTRVARRLGVGTGDLVDDPGGDLRVTGVGIGPSLAGEGIGQSILLTEAGLDARGLASTFTESMVRATPGDVDALVGDLAGRYEIGVREPPLAVANLADLDNLPDALGAFLGLVGVAALAHALASTVRRRRRDLAALRAVGFTPAQCGGAVATMAGTTAAIGLAAGIPLGLGLGRLAWWAVADGTGVATDPALPALATVLVVVAVPVVALLAAAVPGRRAAAISPAALLHDE